MTEQRDRDERYINALDEQLGIFISDLLAARARLAEHRAVTEELAA